MELPIEGKDFHNIPLSALHALLRVGVYHTITVLGTQQSTTLEQLQTRIGSNFLAPVQDEECKVSLALD